MATLSSFRVATHSLLPLALLAFGLTACESGRPGRHGSPEGAATAAASETATPELEAHGSFFSDQIEVEVLLNRTGFAKQDDTSSGGTGGRGGGGGSGGRRRGGGGGRRGGGQMDGGSGSGTASSSDDGPRPNIHESNEAPVRLHLRLTNHGPTPVDVEVIDFNSELGNFVVQPAKITLPPGQSVETDPMTSRLGLRSAEIPLTVSLRRNGQIEKQVLTLHLIEPAPAPTPAPSNPAAGTSPTSTAAPPASPPATTSP